MASTTMGNQLKGTNAVWLTPPEILAALGAFDLDPCAAPSPRPWPTAAHHIELPEDGLGATWVGLVWLNPPYHPHPGPWLHKMALHGHGTALVPARTESAYWAKWVWPYAHAIVFLRGRIRFYSPDGQLYRDNLPIFASALIAYGEADAEQLHCSCLPGFFVNLRANPVSSDTPSQSSNLS